MNPELLAVFPQVFCINLTRRPDRWEHIKRAICSADGLGLPESKLTRVEAVDMPDRPDLGRLLSHQKAFLQAQTWLRHNRTAPYLMICEDDIVFLKTTYVLEKCLKWCRENSRKWGVMNLSAMSADSKIFLYSLFKRLDIKKLPTSQSDFREATEIVAEVGDTPFSVSRIMNVEGSSCYLINTSALSMLHMLLYSRLPDKFRQFGDYSGLIDQVWKDAQTKVPFFMCHPRPAIQVMTHSDILKTRYDYIGLYDQEFIMKVEGNPNICQITYPVNKEWYDFNGKINGEASKVLPTRNPIRGPIFMGIVDKSKVVQTAVPKESRQVPEQPKEHPLKEFGDWVMSLDKNADGLIDIEHRTNPEILLKVQAISEEVYKRLNNKPTDS